MRALFIAILIGGVAWTSSARADIPTIDAAVLTERSQTSSTTLKLVPITTQRKDTNQGVNCAVTTGKKASVADPTVQPHAGAGSRTIQAYAPDMPANPAPGAQGPALNSQTLFKSTGDVVAGLDASRSTLGAAGSGFRTAGQQVGTAPTVMGALDMNSAARVQNNLAWNSTMGSANLWVTALNALNLARSSDASRAAIGMRSAAAPIVTVPSVPACPVGTVGSGTIADPCRSPTGTCSVASASSCATTRFLDGDGSVAFALLPQGTVSVSAEASSLLSLADVIAALATLPSTAR